MEFNKLNGMIIPDFGMDPDKMPLNMFARLVSEDRNNKVYEECLKNEISSMTDFIYENIDDFQLFMLKSIADSVPDSDELRSRGTISEYDIVLMESLHKIIHDTFQRKVEENEKYAKNNSSDDTEENENVSDEKKKAIEYILEQIFGDGEK